MDLSIIEAAFGEYGHTSVIIDQDPAASLIVSSLVEVPCVFGGSGPYGVTPGVIPDDNAIRRFLNLHTVCR